MRIVGMSSFMNSAGAQIALLRLMEHLRKRGHDADTWFFYDQVPAFRGQPHVYSFYEKAKLSPLEYAALPAKLVSRLKSEKPDAVVTFLPLAAVLGQIAAIASGVPRRVASQRAPISTIHPLLRSADAVLGATGVYNANVCVSEAVLNGFARYPQAYRNNLSVIHNGIDWKPSILSREAARIRFGFHPSDIVAIATGRMKTQKNYAFMLDVMQRAPDVTLAIAGDGPLRADLEARRAAHGLETRVAFLDTLDKEGVADLLRAADIFMQTSLYEGQSNSILEAMHEGLPIIASDIETQRETLTRDGAACAILAPLGDASAWGAALNDLANAPEKRAALGASARACVERWFTLNAMIDAFETVITAAPRDVRWPPRAVKAPSL